MIKMLLGETQKDLSIAISDYLTARQFLVDVETNGMCILQRLHETHYDIILLETILEGMDGLTVIRDFRAANGSTPIILISAEHSSLEMQQCLDAGADAYVVKPFKLIELACQLRALLRRPELKSKSILTSGEIAVDTIAGTVTKSCESIHLHPMELKLLQFLLQNPNQVFSADAIFQRVWHKENVQDGTVRTHIRTLRKKIDSPDKLSVITTVRGFGYKINHDNIII